MKSYPTIRRPGPGWRHISGPVWEHEPSKTRLHLGGMIMLKDGESVFANQHPLSTMADHYVRLAGGNRKRGLMMWALAWLEILERLFSF